MEGCVMSVTIIDVARAAGVSKTTVSAVICGRDGVREQTRQRVLDAIEELNYVPNFNARNFVQKRTNILGALIIAADKSFSGYDFTNETGVYSQDICRGIISRLSATRYGLMTAYIYQGDTAPPPMLTDNRIDGLFVINSVEMPKAIKSLIEERNIPVVALGRTYEEFDSIRVDVPRAVYLATDYLEKKNHRRIALVNCAPNIISNSERLEGYRRALDERGIEFDPSLVIDSHDNTGQSGYLAIRRLLGNREAASLAPPSALIAANVSITMGVMKYLYQHNIRVPDDISVIGHEDSVMYSYAAPALTAINIRKETTGIAAADLMIRRLAGNNSGFPVSRFIEPTLTERESVGKYPVQD